MNIIFVVGMHRSGTSLLAEVLANFGVKLPPEILFDSDYPDVCLYESASVVACNERILSRSGHSWLSPLIKKELSVADEEDIYSTLKRIVTGNDGEIIVIKDPRFCFYLQGWLHAAEALSVRVHVFVSIRDPVQVAASLYRRNGTYPAHGMHLWVEYNFALSLLLKDLDSRSYDIFEYHSVKCDTQSVRARLSTVLERWGCRIAPPFECLTNESGLKRIMANRDVPSRSNGILEKIKKDWNLLGCTLLLNPDVLAGHAELMKDGVAEHERSHYGRLLIDLALLKYSIEKSRGDVL